MYIVSIEGWAVMVLSGLWSLIRVSNMLMTSGFPGCALCACESMLLMSSWTGRFITFSHVSGQLC